MKSRPRAGLMSFEVLLFYAVALPAAIFFYLMFIQLVVGLYHMFSRAMSSPIL
jgi:hypothetical protein